MEVLYGTLPPDAKIQLVTRDLARMGDECLAAAFQYASSVLP
jgi:hypothetical protein